MMNYNNKITKICSMCMKKVLKQPKNNEGITIEQFNQDVTNTSQAMVELSQQSEKKQILSIIIRIHRWIMWL